MKLDVDQVRQVLMRLCTPGGVKFGLDRWKTSCPNVVAAVMAEGAHLLGDWHYVKMFIGT